MFRLLLVPLDGSRFAEAALPAACTLARRGGAALALVRVHTPVMAGELAGVERWEREQRHAEREYLARVAQSLRDAAPELHVSTALLEEPVSDAIGARAREIGAELIVMTTHGRTGVSRTWLGSVADDVVRRSDLPVLLVRPRDEPEDTILAPARQAALERVLVPLDGSPLAEQVLDHVVRLAEGAGTGTRITLLRVVRPVIVRAVEYPLPYPLPLPAIDTEATERLVVDARAHLAVLAQHLRQRNPEISVVTEVREQDHPAAAILAAAEDAADVIAMATHGRGTSRLFVGSIADKVLRGATGAVLLYRPAHD